MSACVLCGGSGTRVVINDPSVAKIMAGQIIEDVARKYRTKPDVLVGPSRNRLAVDARNEAIYIMRDSLQMTLKDIGEMLGGRHHSTILNSLRQYELLNPA